MPELTSQLRIQPQNRREEKPVIYTHRIVHVGAMTAPSELRYTSEAAAKEWLDRYPVAASYKAENYRIVPNTAENAHLAPKTAEQ